MPAWIRKIEEVSECCLPTTDSSFILHYSSSELTVLDFTILFWLPRRVLVNADDGVGGETAESHSTAK